MFTKTKQSLEKEIQFYLEIITCEIPLYIQWTIPPAFFKNLCFLHLFSLEHLHIYIEAIFPHHHYFPLQI